MTQNQRIAGVKVAFLVANEGIEQVELERPWEAVKEAGAEPVLIAPDAGTVQAFDHLDKADTFPVHVTTDAADPAEYAGVVLPGGVANPDQLRTDRAAVRFLTDCAGAGKPIAAICHAPWTLIEAGVLKGRRVTSWPSLQTDIRNAGGEWVDEALVTDGNLITSRKPDDLPTFCGAVVESLDHGAAAASA
jgi:protease I